MYIQFIVKWSKVVYRYCLLVEYVVIYVHTRLGLADLMSEELEIGMIETIHKIMFVDH